MAEICLNGTWQLREEPISAGPAEHARVAGEAEWIDTPVPGDVRQGLLVAGKIREPLVALNSLDQHWIEDRSWWFRRAFTLPADALEADSIELEMHGLDANASVFLNGRHVGDHPSAFRPFVAEVKAALQAGENRLLVRLTHGLENVDVEACRELKGFIPTEAGRGRPERGDIRRVFVRKPQFSWGWDWSPRVATVAVGGDVRLRSHRKFAVRDVQVRAARRGRGAALTATVTADWLDLCATGEGTVRMDVRDPAGRPVGRAEWTGLLQSGHSFIDLTVRLRDAKLWWPSGLGRQDRYTIAVEAQAGGVTVRHPPFRYGVRFVELETDGRFGLRVNGVRIFCRGGNWIPPDAVYARPGEAHYEKLIAEARRANFNILRVWGGGRYEPDCFYEFCDRQGILLWHDFMFACAPYPDHLESFRDEVAREADYQTRRLSRYACMALWCGSNESLYVVGLNKPEIRTDRGLAILGRVLPGIVRRNTQTPCWYSSPSGGERPDSWECGDSHHWGLMMSPDVSARIAPEKYDACGARFVSEWGYPGPCGRETTLQYLDGAPFDRRGAVWQHHNNTFEKDTVDAGIRRHYVDPETLSADQYLLYAGLTQGLMLGYAIDAFRVRPNCRGSIFWMYNDAWGEVGWTIIDHYLRRKISYHFVRRAFAPRRLILRAGDGPVRATLANDSARPARGALEFGWTSLDGRCRRTRKRAFLVPAGARKVIASFGRDEADPTGGLWFARAAGITPAILRCCDFRRLRTPVPRLFVKVTRGSGDDQEITVETDAYAHAVHLELPPRATAEDDYFDLLPGERRTVRVAYGGRLNARQVRASCVVNAPVQPAT